MKINAVTGGAGFIGSHIVDALVDRGDSVCAYDDLSASNGYIRRPNPHAGYIIGDILNEYDFEGVGTVFHLAAQTDVTTSVKNPSYDAMQNIIGTIKVLQEATAVGARVVFASSGGAIYGNTIVGADEKTEPKPISPYGVSKLCAEHYINLWNSLYDTNHVILRFSNVYGPGQLTNSEGGVVSIFLDQILNDRESIIYGNGSQTRDFIYVSDVVNAMILASEINDVSYNMFNVSTGVETSIIDLYKNCCNIAQRKKNYSFAQERAGECANSYSFPDRLWRETGWTNKISLEQGIKLTMDWMKEGKV